MSFTHSNNTFISGLFHLTLCFFHKIKPRQNRHGNTYKLYTDIWTHLWRQRAQKVQLQPQKASWDDRTSCSTYASVLFCLFLATVPFPETHTYTHTHMRLHKLPDTAASHTCVRAHTHGTENTVAFGSSWEALDESVCFEFTYVVARMPVILLTPSPSASLSHAPLSSALCPSSPYFPHPSFLLSAGRRWVMPLAGRLKLSLNISSILLLHSLSISLSHTSLCYLYRHLFLYISALFHPSAEELFPPFKCSVCLSVSKSSALLPPSASRSLRPSCSHTPLFLSCDDVNSTVQPSLLLCLLYVWCLFTTIKHTYSIADGVCFEKRK